MFLKRWKNVGYVKHEGAVIKNQVETMSIKIITIKIKNFNERWIAWRL